MNRTTCPPTCRVGTYAFSNNRSTHSTACATCPSSTSLIFATLAMNASIRHQGRVCRPGAEPATGGSREGDPSPSR
jgi:hypothetical protein